MYQPNSLDQERASWRTVIYFNVVRSIKHILATLEAWDDSPNDEANDDDDKTSISHDHSHFAGPSIPSSSSLPGSPPGAEPPLASHSLSPINDSNMLQIANLRQRLSPLVAADKELANRLTGGVTVSGSGKGGVYVRSGWQARTIENALGKARRPKKTSNAAEDKPGRESISTDVVEDVLVKNVGRMLDVLRDDIKDLWKHPTVKALIARRKLKLDEWSEL
jgi:guanine nucleotide-binding protein alpha-1 subunit